jgi:para-nitrobenzyl esterase
VWYIWAADNAKKEILAKAIRLETQMKIRSALIFLSLGVSLQILLPLAAQKADQVSPKPIPDASTLRHTTGGDVVGFLGPDNTYEWRGIPFARPPVGDLRWRSPRPPEAWKGTRNAVDFGSACPQANVEKILSLHGGSLDTASYLREAQYSGSEDCLYLNIVTPRVSAGEASAGNARLPVMVYLHGGGNMSGAGIIKGSALVSSQNVILIATNYRVSHFGFFTHPALRAHADSDEDRSGNYGVLDQIRALQWIRENIANFGGDPHRVTIFGISAGGWDSMALLSSPKAGGLFSGAIPMSGLTLTRSLQAAADYIEKPTPELPASSGELLLQILIQDGTAKDRAAAMEWVARTPAADVAAYLRRKSFADFDRADAVIFEQKKTMWAGVPVRDGAVLSLDGIAGGLARRDGFNHVPVMIGTMRDEDQPYVIRDAHFVEEVPGPNGPEYHIKNVPEFRLVSEYMSALWNADGAQERAASMSRYEPGMVFAYQLDWHEVEPWRGPDHEPHGASHAMDMPLVFGWPPPAGAATHSEYFSPLAKDGAPGYAFVSQAMMSYWTEFAYTGRPGKGRHGELPEWKPWNNAQGAPKFMMLDSPRGGGLRMATEGVTKAKVLEKLAHDDRFSSTAARCEFLGKLVNYATAGGRITPRDYDHFAGGACAK